MVQQRIHQRSRCMAGSWVHDEAGRFIHHHDVLVFIDHSEWNIFGEECRLAHGRNDEVQCLPRNERRTGSHDKATHGEMPLGDQSLDKRARESAPICHKSVCTLPRRLWRDRQIEFACLTHVRTVLRDRHKVSTSKITMPKLIPASAMLKVQNRRLPTPTSMKSST